MRLGSIEAGGTKFVCAVGDDQHNIIDQTTFPTTTPEATLQQTIAWFQEHPVDALGIGTFGPIEIRPTHPQYGYITNTPKPGWQNTDFVGPLRAALNCPISWTTDVNSSAYGEYIMRRRADPELSSLVYYTIGTGVGAGIVNDGEFVGAAGHPEAGHTFVKRHPDDQSFAGICPVHGDCLEGVVSGPTFDARLHQSGATVPHNHPVWTIMSDYVAQAAIQATLLLRPHRIVFGGGVMNPDFLAQIRTAFTHQLNGYVDVGSIDEYLSMPVVAGNGSATVGNFALAAKQLTTGK